MGDAFNIGTSGLLALQRAISTTGHNITNSGNATYSRQSADFRTQTPQVIGGLFIGSGVYTSAITRSADELVNQQLRSSIATFSQLESYGAQASQIDLLLADQSSSLSTGLQNFFSGLQQVNETPDYLPSRELFLNQLQTLVSQFDSLYQQVQVQKQSVNQQLSSAVNEINTLSLNLADVNARIITTQGNAPDLLDERDRLLNELSAYVSVTPIQQTDGTINVAIGSGQMIVVGTGAIPLAASPSANDPFSTDISLNLNGNNIDITGSISGGVLGGLLSFNNEILVNAQNTLGQISLGMASTMNAQHQLGMDLNNNLGQPLFSDFNAATLQAQRSLASTNNTGNAVFNVAISNTNNLTSADYVLSVAGGPSFTLTNLTTNTTTAIAGFPATVDGFTINLASGAAVAGDSFKIIPTRNAASDLAVNITDASQVAVAAPIRTSINTANLGDGQITAGTVVSTATADFTTTPGQLTPPLRLEFLSATSYQVVNATTSAVIEGPIVYNPAVSNNLFPTPGAYDPGYRVSISGAPQTGDSFNIAYNSGGVADNRNGLLLADIQTNKTMEGSTASFQDVYAGLISDVGTKTHQADLNRQASQILLDNVQARRDSISGVNLDEEAAKLLQYEQAYQAASQVIATASRLFDIIFDSIGR